MSQLREIDQCGKPTPASPESAPHALAQSRSRASRSRAKRTNPVTRRTRSLTVAGRAPVSVRIDGNLTVAGWSDADRGVTCVGRMRWQLPRRAPCRPVEGR